MKTLIKLSASIIFLLTFASTFPAQTAKAAVNTSQVGLGFQLFDPTGISLKLGKTSANSIHAVLGWGGHTDVNFQGDYLWNQYRLIPLDSQYIDGYFGIGARLQERDREYKDRDPGDSDFAAGVRVPGGLSWLAPNKKIEVFADLALVMNLIPSTHADIDFALGFHYFF